MAVDDDLATRVHYVEEKRKGDNRTDYDRDYGRIVHSAAFRRMQGKTQVMGIGEGDFHRTRLTHSIEAAQIGSGVLNKVASLWLGTDNEKWLPSESLIRAACLAHDIGHPPYGHGGERALQSLMSGCGGFEGNAQTLRILTKLEKSKERNKGINPTKRLVLSVLKYPVKYSEFSSLPHKEDPPKCYYDDQDVVVQDVINFLDNDEQKLFTSIGPKGKPINMSFDASIMECADDIAYGVHDLEDIVARKFITADDLRDSIKSHFGGNGKINNASGEEIELEDLIGKLFSDWSGDRKQMVGKLVNLFVTSVEIDEIDGFQHPLVKYRANFGKEVKPLLNALKDLTYEQVVRRPGVQHLERKGQRIIKGLFNEIMLDPEGLIPPHALGDLDPNDTMKRRVCDYIACMTDTYAERIYHRLFTPGFGSSSDEF